MPSWARATTISELLQYVAYQQQMLAWTQAATVAQQAAANSPAEEYGGGGGDDWSWGAVGEAAAGTLPRAISISVPIVPLLTLSLIASTAIIPNDTGPRMPPVTVYRVYGGGSPLYGQSWTPVDPRSFDNYREVAGLPSTKSGTLLAEGQLIDRSRVVVRNAIPLAGTRGGLVEIVVPDPKRQINVTAIHPLDPPY